MDEQFVPFHPTKDYLHVFDGFAYYRGPTWKRHNTFCREYHIRSALWGAYDLAKLVLGYARDLRLDHKVVRDPDCLIKQIFSPTAGKFITLYLNPALDLRNQMMAPLDTMLLKEKQAKRIDPGYLIPRIRIGKHTVGGPELMIGQSGFIFTDGEVRDKHD